jgi:hypothetical protein
MLVVVFGNPGIPPPGFSIWRALRFTVRLRLARVANPGVHGGRANRRGVTRLSHAAARKPAMAARCAPLRPRRAMLG